jgi:glycosyltransferase involved in cell wall biosynthesis
MRIVIDLQSCQSGSRRSGIGRYSLGLAKAMALQPRGHEIWIVLSALMSDSVPEVRRAFDGILPSGRIRVFDLPRNIEMRTAPPARVRAAEIVREDFLQSLNPDFVHIMSLFEGFGEEVVTSVGQYFPGIKTSVTLHDLIPLVQSARYFLDTETQDFFKKKIENIKNAGLLLANSEFSRLEGIDLLGMRPEQVVNVSSAADERFKPITLDPEKSARLLARYGIKRKFLMYTASFDPRKNQSGLVSAFSLLPRQLRTDYQLVIVGTGSDDELVSLKELTIKSGLEHDEVVFPGHVVDSDLVGLYNLCHLFVLPSLSEGFGLPALEAMSCGTATIGSNVTSLPEVIGWSEALFDPTDAKSISNKIHRALTDPGFHQELRERGLTQAKKFSWKQSADKVFDAFELHAKRNKATVGENAKPNSSGRLARADKRSELERVTKAITQIEHIESLSSETLMEIAIAIASNRESVPLPSALSGGN